LRRLLGNSHRNQIYATKMPGPAELVCSAADGRIGGGTMLRLGNIIGLAVGGLLGYLLSFDIDTSLGQAKVPFYIGMGALFGWLSGFVFHVRQPGEPSQTSRDENTPRPGGAANPGTTPRSRSRD